MKFLIWKLGFRRYEYFKFKNTGTVPTYLVPLSSLTTSSTIVVLYDPLPFELVPTIQIVSIISRTYHAQSQLQLFALLFDAFDLPIVRGSVTGGIGTSKNAFVACASVYFAYLTLKYLQYKYLVLVTGIFEISCGFRVIRWKTREKHKSANYGNQNTGTPEHHRYHTKTTITPPKSPQSSRSL